MSTNFSMLMMTDSLGILFKYLFIYIQPAVLYKRFYIIYAIIMLRGSNSVTSQNFHKERKKIKFLVDRSNIFFEIKAIQNLKEKARVMFEIV